MFFNNDRNQLRSYFFSTWKKYKNESPLEAQQKLILEVLLLHPEYQAYLENPEKYMDEEFTPEKNETNPFLHMSLHLGIREQIALNRPKGLHKIHGQFLKKYQDQHTAEHEMMDILAECIWEAQKYQLDFDEKKYIKAFKKKLRKVG